MLGTVGHAAVTLLSNGELDTLALGEGNQGLLGAVTDDEHVLETSGKDVAKTVLDVDNVEGSGVAITVNEGTNTACVTTTSDHHLNSNVKRDDLLDGSSLELVLDGVVDLQIVSTR